MILDVYGLMGQTVLLYRKDYPFSDSLHMNKPDNGAFIQENRDIPLFDNKDRGEGAGRGF